MFFSFAFSIYVLVCMQIVNASSIVYMLHNASSQVSSYICLSEGDGIGIVTVSVGKCLILCLAIYGTWTHVIINKRVGEKHFTQN